MKVIHEGTLPTCSLHYQTDPGRVFQEKAIFPHHDAYMCLADSHASQWRFWTNYYTLAYLQVAHSQPTQRHSAKNRTKNRWKTCTSGRKKPMADPGCTALTTILHQATEQTPTAFVDR